MTSEWVPLSGEDLTRVEPGRVFARVQLVTPGRVVAISGVAVVEGSGPTPPGLTRQLLTSRLILEVCRQLRESVMNLTPEEFAQFMEPMEENDSAGASAGD